MCPGEDKTGKVHGSKTIGLRIFWGLTLLFLIVLTLYVSGIKKKVHRELNEIQRSHESVRLRSEKIKQAKRSRIHFLQKQSFLRHPGRFSFEAALFLNTLNRIAPPSVGLMELKMVPLNRNLGFEIKGRAVPRATPEPGSEAGLFYSRLNSIEGLIYLSRNSTPGSPPPDSFHYQGQIEIQ